MQRIISAIVTVATCLLTSVCWSEAADKPVRPNVVLILADDLGWNSSGCFGSDFYESPNIDKLASQGMRFDNGYAADPICAPTRASLMSGWDVPRHKVLRVSDNHRNLKKHGKPKTRLIQPPHQGYLDAGVVTLAEVFQSNGYRTGMFGKWHLGWWKDEYQPPALGFDEFKMKREYKHFDTKLLPKGVNADEKIPEGVYLTDYMCGLALDFMERSAKRGQPFFLYLPDLLVHSPFETINGELDHFEAKPRGKMHHDAPLAAMIMSLDRTVGRVMDQLEKLGVTQNTLLVFTSDNGGVPLKADGEWWRKFEPNTSNGVLKGGKGAVDEGGIRVPYIFRFPGRIPEGTLSHEPIVTQDLYPTLLAQAGLDRPKGHVLDGIDISANLADPAKSLPGRALYWYHSNYSFAGRAGMAMREGDWKFCYYFENDEEEMFNLAEDIGEEHNLVATQPERAKRMRARLDAWAKARKAPPHLPNPDYKPGKQTRKPNQ
jgi:arylsulfatase A-like enzyme